MRPDWYLWALGGMVGGIAYGIAVAELNIHRCYGPRRKWLLFAEIAVAAGMIAGLVLGFTGLWWLARPLAAAYISIGGPVAVVLLVTGAAEGASEDEYAEIQRIKSRSSRSIRTPGDAGRGFEGENISN